MKPIFDLHFHPLGKRFLSEYEDNKRQNKWYTDEIILPRLGAAANAAVNRILNSQACVRQAKKAGIVLGVASIVAPEYVFASKKGILALLEFDIFGRDVIAPLDNRYFDFVRANRNYNFLLVKELAFYKWAAEYPTTAKSQINILSRKKAGGTKVKEGKLNLAMAIEGGHNLCNHSLSMHTGNISPAALVREYRQKTYEFDFLYLTLTHLSHISRQMLCNHAYGFKMVKGLLEAYPQLNGLTPLGKEVIRECMDCTTTKYPVLIDIKHMSLKGRLDFYRERNRLMDENKLGLPRKSGKNWWPILATHMGVTGCRLLDMPALMDEFGLERGLEQCVRVRFRRDVSFRIPEGIKIDNVSFNPATINLCDEDIEEVAKSDGLIGISLDSRILGFESFIGRRRQNNEYDYFSKEDFSHLFPEQMATLKQVKALEEELLMEESTTIVAGKKKREIYLFCLNVLHIVAVINALPEEERHKKKGWEFICLGSDYDGLIDSIRAADIATDLPSLRNAMVKYLPRAEKAYRETMEYPGELFPLQNGDLDLLTFLNLLLHDNGSRFIKEWWNI